MELTEEQDAIINSNGNIKINAVAGSGKTTTVVEYAKARPTRNPILYLAFNKSVRLEAARKFAECGLSNVKVETAHSLAYKSVVFKNNYSVRAQGYRTNEVAELLGLKGSGEDHAEYVLANHINKFAAYFCNSDARKVQELNYLDLVSDEKARAVVSNYYDYLHKKTRLFLAMMDRGQIDVTHDFYLKKFQLSDPILPFEYILFDEGQDASPAMLDVFLKQEGTKLIVGDTHQQIYGWRYAVNSLEKADFHNYSLSTSFRFNQEIANLAVGVLRLKKHTGSWVQTGIRGRGVSHELSSKAVLARTNLGLLLRAIEDITESRSARRIYFEGNINSYTYADEGTSLYDVLSLYNGNRKMIRDGLIGQMKDFGELEDYVDKTEDAQLGMMVDIVKEYDNEIPGMIRELKERHVANEDRGKADVIFSTVHRCKGLEYDVVELVNDFITEEKLEKFANEDGESKDLSRLNEEINLLYVAVTRAKNKIVIPDTLLPAGISSSSRVSVSSPDRSARGWMIPAASRSGVKALYPGRRKKLDHHDAEEVRSKHKEAYMPWTEDLDNELMELYRSELSVKRLAKHFGRTAGAIRARIRKLGIE